MMKFANLNPMFTDEVTAGVDSENVYLRAIRHQAIREIGDPEYDSLQCCVVLDEDEALALADFLLSAIKLRRLKQDSPTFVSVDY